MILSAQADMVALVCAINDAQIYRFQPKPWDEKTLVSVLKDAFLRRAELIKERRLANAQRVQFGQISPEEEARQELEREAPV